MGDVPPSERAPFDGDMAIFDISADKVETYLTGYGGNGGSTVNRKLGQYYHSTSGESLMVVDILEVYRRRSGRVENRTQLA